ncbi:MAG: threonine dehydratase [Anaerolineaceae bacterium]|nr:threonine dehydratase [Anaerolineaceae bacterium]MCB9099316.1 threonine dehydratase [Anaerolineales bacterium]
MTEQPMPTLHDIIAARPNVYRYLKPTPLHYYSGLSELVGAQVWVKHENHQPVGAFKVRGGLNLAANLTEAERQAGLFTASTGNHGQSIAFGARAYGIKATIAVPEGANPGKVAAMRGLGGNVVVHGKDFDTAREWIMGQAEAHGGRFIGPTEERLICGVGTYALEIVEDLPQVDTIIVPVGAGSGACGTSIVAKSINPQIEVIAVQSAQAPAMQRSWQRGELVTAEMNTFAEGIATRVPFPNTQRIMRRYLDDFVLVDDADIKQAVGLMLEHTRNLAEGAGAAPLAAALQLKDRLAGKKVVLILSGGNLSMEKLKGILSTYETH